MAPDQLSFSHYGHWRIKISLSTEQFYGFTWTFATLADVQASLPLSGNFAFPIQMKSLKHEHRNHCDNQLATQLGWRPLKTSWTFFQSPIPYPTCNYCCTQRFALHLTQCEAFCKLTGLYAYDILCVSSLPRMACFPNEDPPLTPSYHSCCLRAGHCQRKPSPEVTSWLDKCQEGHKDGEAMLDSWAESETEHFSLQAGKGK